MVVTLSYRDVLLLLPSIVYASGKRGRTWQASATLKNKIHAVKSSCTIAIYPSDSKSRTRRRNIPSDMAGRTFEFSSLPLPLSLSISRRCLYHGFLTRVPGHPSRANYPKQIRHCLLRANLIRACILLLSLMEDTRYKRLIGD